MPDSRPNILFIMSDDHAAQAISAYGCGINQTPNIDRIAAKGAILNHCYVNNSICTPSRAAILTGTHSHVNGVITLDTPFNNHLSHVAKHLQAAGYQTSMIGKWHLGEGPEHSPTGFDHWSVLPDQGDYFDPYMIENGRHIQEMGYATEIITEKCVDQIRQRDKDRPFFMMCHHKAPHRPWLYHPKYEHLYNEEIPYPPSFKDDYANRAKAAVHARMRVESDMTYLDLDLVQPYIPAEGQEYSDIGCKTGLMMVPFPKTPEAYRDFKLICRRTGQVFTFANSEELKRFKYQRYMQKYLRTVASIDESVGHLLDLLETEGIADNTIVIYTSDQGFFLGEHGWYDKRFIYEESFRMPFLVQYPQRIRKGITVNAMASNVDFAPTWLDYAGVPVPSYMQGYSLRCVLEGDEPASWQKTAYHRYWMNQDCNHNAYAHYGIRDHRYKLIYWYNEPMNLPGATAATFAEKDWELFDLQEDPLELNNCFHDQDKKDVVIHMLRLLDEKQTQIGDVPAHDSRTVLAMLG
ncbi:MAG TPA: sulfatase [Verrucomicrobia bacterium]|nr:sulfatase [Verrucomicrobiota bacterium]